MAGGRLAGLLEGPHHLGVPGSPHTPHAAALAWDVAVCDLRSEDAAPCGHRKRPALSPAGTRAAPEPCAKAGRRGAPTHSGSSERDQGGLPASSTQAETALGTRKAQQ